MMKCFLVLLFIFYSKFNKTYSFSTNIRKTSLYSNPSYYYENPTNKPYTIQNYGSKQHSRLNLFESPPIGENFFETALLVNLPIATLLVLGKQKSLTSTGLAHSTALGIGLFTFLGFNGWAVGVLYFVLGSIATKVKMKEKEKLGIAEKRGGARGPENVWGSAASATICAMASYIYPEYAEIFRLGFVTSFATKLSDTVGSEIGKAYGKTTYLITNLQLVPKGTEGAVSLEGTVAGVIASVILGSLGLGLNVISTVESFEIVVFSAFFATTIESFIGAVFQDDVKWLNNELVNLIMTLIGASTAMTIQLLFF